MGIFCGELSFTNKLTVPFLSYWKFQLWLKFHSIDSYTAILNTQSQNWLNQSSLIAQHVKNLVLSLQWLELLLRGRFDLYTGNFYMPWVQPKKKKRLNQNHQTFQF